MLIKVIAIIAVMYFIARVAYKFGRLQGRKQGDSSNIIPMLESIKFMADNSLRQFVSNSEFSVLIGDKAVRCTSPMETAQFSESLKELLTWFKPVNELPPSET